MMTAHCASNCRWAVPTLTMPGHEWIQAAECEWTCTLSVPPVPLLTTDGCAACEHWRARPMQDSAADEDAWPDHVAHPLMPDIIVHPI